MTDETKKLFDAPWVVDAKIFETFGEVFDVMDEDLYLHYARCYEEKTANRLARLPELYDALVYFVVNDCPHAFISNDECRLCPDKKCKSREAVELLRKVRDGE